MWYRRKQRSPRSLPGFVALEFTLFPSVQLRRLSRWLCIGLSFSILNNALLPWYWRLLLWLLLLGVWRLCGMSQLQHVRWIDNERWQLTLVSGQRLSAHLTWRAMAIGSVLLLCWQASQPVRSRYWYAYVHETEVTPAIFRALKGRLNC
jgi:hypothetical protein